MDLEEASLRIREANNRDEAAAIYLSAINLVPPDDSGFWRNFNAEIIERWSLAGLKYVKGQAWKRVERVISFGPTPEGDEDG